MSTSLRHWRDRGPPIVPPPSGSRLAAALGLAAVVLGCATSPPPFMVGAHVDDYGSRHLIAADRWIQDSAQRYHIVR
ncbi:MAG: hypothetical protein AB7N73_15950, partial [Gemmatimonadales bacterium]